VSGKKEEENIRGAKKYYNQQIFKERGQKLERV